MRIKESVRHVSGSANVGIHAALIRLKLTYKKSLRHPLGNASAQHTFQQKIESYKAQDQPIIYLDESGFEQDASRTHGLHSKDNPVTALIIGTPESVRTP